MSYLPSSGITPAHFAIFQTVAHQSNRIMVVRNTNTKSTMWIAQGYPPKPKNLEFLHTSDRTGRVTVKGEDEKRKARQAGFYVIDPDGVARRQPHEMLQKRFPFNTPEMNEPGQVIDLLRQRALVGDYDLMGVIDPDAKGRVLALHSVNGMEVTNRSNPDVDRVIDALNRRMDQPRVMRGPQDLYQSFKGACTAFLPNGTVRKLTTERAVRDFYAGLGRPTITGTHA